MKNSEIEAYRAWKPEDFIDKEKDDRFKIINYAILAANTHNIQPWRIKLGDEDELDLFIDATRLLRSTDPDLRHIYISQGTFIETFIIAASNFGYDCDVKLLPQGIPSIDNPDELPVATIRLHVNQKVLKQPLFDYITKRNTNHSVFSGPAITDYEKKSLTSSNRFSGNDFQIVLFDQVEMKSKISDLMVKAMAIQTKVPETHEETIKMIRFNKKTAYKLKDGFTFKDLGVSGIKLRLAEIFASPFLAQTPFFKQNIVNATRKMAESAQAFGVIYAPSDTRENQLITGQIFCRSHLTSTMLKLSFQPMDHIFQKYSQLNAIEHEMCELVSISNKIPMAVFRVGHSIHQNHTPRRPILDLLN